MLVVGSALIGSGLIAQADPALAAPNLSAASIALTTVATGLSSPVALAWRHNDARMYVAEQPGRVRIVNTNGTLVTTPVLTVAVSGGNEQGLLGLVFSSDGTKLYVDYTDPTGNTHVDEYTMNGDVANTATKRQILFQTQPFANHNGGEVIFGPDGNLYIGLGDGGSGGDPQGNGQNLNTWLGKILRINPNQNGQAAYSVPSDNPFVGQTGKKPENWMYGLRNPWRFSFDRTTGDAWIGDVGQDLYEEIDVAAAGQSGQNWGWNKREGLHAYNGGVKPAGAVDPVLELAHANSYCAVIGGYVYRGSAIADLPGAYVFGDSCRANLVGISVTNGQVTSQRDLGVSVSQLTTFGQDPNGELYAAARTGTAYKLTQGTITTTTTKPSTTTTSTTKATTTTTSTTKPSTTTTSTTKATTTTTKPSTTTTTTTTLAPTTTTVPNVTPHHPRPVGYWEVGADGRVWAYHGAVQCATTAAPWSGGPVVGVAGTAKGYWTVSRSGAVTACGRLVYGSLRGARLNSPIAGIVATPSGRGYWLFASDGGVFGFGDARYFGSTGSMRLNRPIVGMSVTPSGRGYWLVAADGGIFGFGDARYFGSTGSMRLNRPIVGLSVTPSGRGYWLVASDGGIFGFGDARYYGSMGSMRLNSRIVGMSATPGHGYWLVARDGGVFGYGDARFYGAPTSATPPPNVTGIAHN